jgi:hypothetical protein
MAKKIDEQLYSKQALGFFLTNKMSCYPATKNNCTESALKI